jgi:hypothetical protein
MRRRRPWSENGPACARAWAGYPATTAPWNRLIFERHVNSRRWLLPLGAFFWQKSRLRAGSIVSQGFHLADQMSPAELAASVFVVAVVGRMIVAAEDPAKVSPSISRRALAPRPSEM